MAVAFTVFAAVAPSVVLLWVFYTRDAHPEPRRVVLLTFLLGVAATVPVLIVGIPLLLVQPENGHPLLIGAFAAFVVAAIPEESCKYLVVTRFSARRAAFDEPMDGIVYGVTASLGFATLENALYVATGGWVVAIMRAFTAVPGHAFLGAILGYFVGKSRFAASPRTTALAGLLLAILFHGLYDLAPMTISSWDDQGKLDVGKGSDALLLLLLLAFAIAVLIAEAVLAFLFVRRLRRAQIAAPAGKGE